MQTYPTKEQFIALRNGKDDKKKGQKYMCSIGEVILDEFNRMSCIIQSNRANKNS